MARRRARDRDELPARPPALAREAMKNGVNRVPFLGRAGVAARAACGLVAAAAALAAGNPADVVGPETCNECHKAEVAAWQKTHHAVAMDKLREGTEIATKLGIERTYRRDGPCLDCHTTRIVEAERTRAVAGVACESCHGAARGWVKVHNDYGGPGVTKEQESAEHRAERWKKSEGAGMLRPGNLYAVASNCFGCHTVPNQELVDKGGHKAGSDFELVAWSQGEVRHNYLGSQGQQNAEPGVEHLRVMYVVGRALDLEHALRGLAGATGDGAYSQAMKARAERAFAALGAAQGKVKIAEFADLLAGGLKTDSASAARLSEAVAAAAKKFAASADGGALAAIDALLPAKDRHKGPASP